MVTGRREGVTDGAEAPGNEEESDGSPGPGILGSAVGIGVGGYLLARHSGAD